MIIIIINLQSAADFSDIDTPKSAYEKTQPVEACKKLLLSLIFEIFLSVCTNNFTLLVRFLQPA